MLSRIWNKRINNVLGRPNPKLKDVPLCIKRESESSTFMFVRSELNLEGKKRKIRYQKLDERVDKPLHKYEANRYILSCLKTLPYINKLG